MRLFSTLSPLACLAFVLLLATGCAATRALVPAPVGVWSLTVHDTPEGNAPGTMTLAYLDGAYTGEITIDLLSQTVPVANTTYVDDTLTFNATFDINGQNVITTSIATITDGVIEGTMDVPGFGNFRLSGKMATPSM